ncbi:hypothetical protein MRB53_003059 [Persea americana]|uniref:Uncharacterized protein n=1 Tax=Persea americana TaxID=3435 RepID=A0ACC2MW83_PERAE|nr:hypothetical protein MRB53_003059 [Persea americana]
MLARVISPGSLCESGAVMKISVRDIYITKIDALVFHETVDMNLYQNEEHLINLKKENTQTLQSRNQT